MTRKSKWEHVPAESQRSVQAGGMVFVEDPLREVQLKYQARVSCNVCSTLWEPRMLVRCGVLQAWTAEPGWYRGIFVRPS